MVGGVLGRWRRVSEVGGGVNKFKRKSRNLNEVRGGSTRLEDARRDLRQVDEARGGVMRAHG